MRARRRAGRTLRFGYRVHVIVRETESLARAAARRLLSRLDAPTGDAIRNRSLDAASEGVRRQAEMRDVVGRRGLRRGASLDRDRSRAQRLRRGDRRAIRIRSRRSCAATRNWESRRSSCPDIRTARVRSVRAICAAAVGARGALAGASAGLMDLAARLRLATRDLVQGDRAGAVRGSMDLAARLWLATRETGLVFVGQTAGCGGPEIDEVAWTARSASGGRWGLTARLWLATREAELLRVFPVCGYWVG